METKSKGLDSFQLKVIGLITMTIDHIGFFLAASLTSTFLGNPIYLWLRLIGRIAFPIFAFLVVIAVIHTSNYKRYFWTLFSLGVIFQSVIYYTEQAQGNIFLTLAFGSLAVQGLKERKYHLVSIALVVATINELFVGQYTFLDYGLYGILIIMMLGLIKLYYSVNVVTLSAVLIITTMLFQPQNIFCVLAIPFILMFNGNKGHSMKYFFYIYYPLHIVVLYFTSLYI